MREAILGEFKKQVEEPFQHILPESYVILLTKTHLVIPLHFVRVAEFKSQLTLLRSTAIEKNITEHNIIIQFLNNNIPHYAYLKIMYLSEKRTSCLLVDASTPIEHFPGFVRKLRDHFDHVYTIVGCDMISKIQIDTKSCPIFAYYHANLFSGNAALTECVMNQSHVLSNDNQERLALFEMLGITGNDETALINKLNKIDEFESECGMVAESNLSIATWKEMPPEVIRHIQSLSFAEKYCLFQSQKGNVAAATDMQLFLEAQVSEHEINGLSKQRNLGIVLFSRAILNEIEDFLVRTSDEEVWRMNFHSENSPVFSPVYFDRCTPADLTELHDASKTPKKAKAFEKRLQKSASTPGGPETPSSRPGLTQSNRRRSSLSESCRTGNESFVEMLASESDCLSMERLFVEEDEAIFNVTSIVKEDADVARAFNGNDDRNNMFAESLRSDTPPAQTQKISLFCTPPRITPKPSPKKAVVAQSGVHSEALSAPPQIMLMAPSF